MKTKQFIEVVDEMSDWQLVFAMLLMLYEKSGCDPGIATEKALMRELLRRSGLKQYFTGEHDNAE